MDAADEARWAAGVAKAVLQLKYIYICQSLFVFFVFSDRSIDQCEDKMRPYHLHSVGLANFAVNASVTSISKNIKRSFKQCGQPRKVGPSLIR